MKRLSFSIAINLLTENFKKGANSVKNHLRSIQMQILTFAAALGAGGVGLMGLISKMKDVARETSRALTALKNVSGGVGLFADNLQFLNKLAKDYGVEINTLVFNFAKFKAAGDSVGMSLEDQRKIFESVSRAAVAYGMSAEDTNLTFLAVTQMMSKGKISSEELRRQLGERLPIAMAAMAKAAGVPITKLDDLLKKGKLLSHEVLPKFADALNDMIPSVNTDNIETSLNRLSNAFTKFTEESGIGVKYKAIIDGLTGLIESASKNIHNIIIGIVTAIVFVVTNGVTKVWRSYQAVGTNIITSAEAANAKMSTATAARIEAEIALDRAKSAAFFATEKQRLQAAQAIAKAEATLSRKVIAETKAIEASKLADAKAAAIKTGGFWVTTGAMIKGTFLKLGAAIKSMWNSFAPALIVSAIVAVIGYFKNMYDEAKRIKNIFSDYRKEAEKSGNTQEVVMLQKQLSIMNDKASGQKEINAAQSALQKMLGKEKLSHEEINKQISERIELLKEAAKADYFAQKIPALEDKMRSAANSQGLTLGQITGFARRINKGESYKDLEQDIGKAVRERGIKGIYDLSGINDLIKETVQDLRVWDDANSKLGEAVKKANDLASTTPTNDPDKKKDNGQKVIDNQLKLQNAKARAELDARNKELENQQALLDLEQEGFDKQQKQIALNHKKEILGIDTRTQDLIEKQQEAERKLWDIEHPDATKTKELFRTKTNSYIDLSDDNKSELIASDDIAVRQREKAGTALLKSLVEKYQDYNTRRIKLEKDYNEEIKFLGSKRNETNSTAIDAATAELIKQRDKALSSINLEEFQDSIDWSTVFGNLDRISTESLQDVRDKLKNYLSEAGSSISPTDLQTVTDAMEKMNLAIADRNPINELKSSYSDYKQALVDVVAAKEKLNNLEEGTAEYTEAAKELTDAEKARRASLTAMSQSMNSFGEKGNQLVNSGTEIIDMLGAFGVEVDGNVSKTLAGVGQMMSGLESIDLTKPFSIVTSSITMITGAGKAIAGIFGMFGGSDKDTKRYQEMKAQYESLNKVWDELINKKKEYISISYGEEARKVGEEAMRLTKKQIESNRELGKAYMNSFKNKGGSSWGVRQQSRIKGDDWKDLAHWKRLNNISDELFNSVTTGRMTGLFDLTAEQLESLKEEAPSLWAKLEDQTKEYLNNIIDGADRLEDINKSLKEQFTQISLDSFKDGYTDMLEDMDSSNQDFADNFEKYLQKAILSSLIGTKYKSQIESLYDDFADANSDGTIDEAEMSILKKKQDDLAAQMLADRDKLKETFGWESDSSKSQSGSTGYSVSMDQDTGGAILGRITGLQETALRMESMLSGLSLSTNSIFTQSTFIGTELKKQTEILDEIKQVQIKSFFITEEMGVTLEKAVTKLEKIDKNTKNL